MAHENLATGFSQLFNKLENYDSSALRVAVGKVTDHVYHRGYYKVAGPGGKGEDISLVELGALRADGQTAKESIPIGSYVFYIFAPELPVGYILGCVSGVRPGDPAAPRPAMKFRVTGSPETYEPSNMDASPHRIMGGDHVPMDLAASAFARTNPSGGALVLDNHFLLAQVREMVGFTAMEDGTVQVSGETLFIRSFLKEYQEFKNKFGVDGVEDVFLSVATGLGYKSQAEMAEIVSKEENDPDDTTVTARAPLPFASKHTGETAEGFSTVVRAYKDKTRDSGVPLLRETIYRDGSYVLQSASQIFIEKFCLIEDPLARKETPDDDDNVIKPLEFEHKGSAKVSGIAAMNSEYLSYLLGTKFTKEQKRFWTVNDTKKIAQTLAISSAVFNNPDARSLPKAAQVLVDLEKNISRTLYGSRSGIYLTDDGSILIKDGYGSSITMGRGNITLSPAKDMIFQVGQDVVTVAGGEINSVAMKGISVSAEGGGVSLNSSEFFNIRSTSPTSGILIESLAAKDKKDDKGKPVGIVFRTKDGVVSTLASRIESKANTQTHSSAEFSVDAVSVSLHAESTLKFIPQKMSAAISDSTPGIFMVSGQTVLNSSVQLRKEVSIGGGVTLDGNLLMSGSLTCLGAGAFESEPAAMPQRAIDQLKKTFEKIFKAFDTNVATMTRVYERQRLVEAKRLVDLYLNNTNNTALKFKVASTKKIPYELAQAEWQKYSTYQLPTIPEVTSGIPAMLYQKAVFWKADPTRVDAVGAYKPNTDQVKETELKKFPLLGFYTINVSDEEYKRDPYDQE